MKCSVFFGVIFLGSLVSWAAYTAPSTAVSKYNSFRSYSDLTNAAKGIDIDTYTYNLTTWQIDNGGFYKAMEEKYKSPYTSGQNLNGAQKMVAISGQ